jgi:hypothetical protein
MKLTVKIISPPRSPRNFESVSDKYFRRLTQDLGRDYTDDADTKQPVIAISEFARKHWEIKAPDIRSIFNLGESHHGEPSGAVSDILMEKLLDQQNDTAGSIHTVAGRAGNLNCTVVVRPRAGQRADTLGPAHKAGYPA